ncbi:MAG: hypothetical protein ACNI28_09225 [Arcobacter sp.]|uniref:hypothetical protein n=1 Tax=Arcobacter sp. TaxID=1872629 RepID=UPI003AFFF4E9
MLKNEIIAKLIQKNYKFIYKPTKDEVKEILSKIDNSTTEEEFEQIIFDTISNTNCYLNESIDMNDTISILEQIQKILDAK